LIRDPVPDAHRRDRLRLADDQRVSFPDWPDASQITCPTLITAAEGSRTLRADGRLSR
jgi:hypothetical protein